MTDYATPFLVALGAKVTAQMKAAVAAWQTQESGSRVIGNNPWNLHVGPPCPATAGEGVKGYPHSQPLSSSTIIGLIGNRYAGPGDQNVAIFDTPDHGSAAAARNLLGPNAKTYGYDRVVAAARAGDPIGFLNALAASSWSAGRYGTRNGGTNTLLAIYRRLAPAPIPTGDQPVEAEGDTVAVDLTIPSPDTVGQLRQWLQVRKSPPASGFFHDNAGQADAQVVQLVATIVGHGTAYFRKGAISPSVLKLAQKLNAGNAFNLTPEYSKSLETGEPEYARSLGVTSGRITA